jgi:hypothetical protein
MSQPVQRPGPSGMLRAPSSCRLLKRHSRGMLLVGTILLAVGYDGSLPWLSATGEYIAEAAVSIEMVTDPAQEQIFPDRKAAQLTFKAAVDRKPLRSGRLKVQVIAPPRPVLLSTPLPAVEGTTLLQLTSELTDGKFAVEYLFPISGVYTFDFDIAPGLNGQAVQPTTTRHSLHLQADPATVRRAWLFRLVLLCLGGIAGAWCALTAQAPKTLPPRAAITSGVLIVGSLAVVTSTLTFADHGPRELVFPKGAQVIQGDEGWALEVRPTPEQAVVGELLDLTVTLTRKGQAFSGAMDVSMHLYNLKDDQTVLRTNIVTPHGSTSQQFQLVESVPHTCTVTVRPVGDASEKPVTLTAVIGIEVIAGAIPITVKLRVMGLFVGVVGAGVTGGYVLASGVRKLPGRVGR